MPGYDPSLIVLAFEGEEPVGASVNLAADDGVGWVGDLGVREAWRRRGAGRALLARSFAELAARGHHEVRLGVDTENATGATDLYAGIGMTVRRRHDLYEKQLTGAWLMPPSRRTRHEARDRRRQAAPRRRGEGSPA